MKGTIFCDLFGGLDWGNVKGTRKLVYKVGSRSHPVTSLSRLGQLFTEAGDAAEGEEPAAGAGAPAAAADPFSCMVGVFVARTMEELVPLQDRFEVRPSCFSLARAQASAILPVCCAHAVLAAGQLPGG